jgi:hypothetical protein
VTVRRRRAAAATAALVIAAMASPPATTVHAAAPRIDLVSQTFNLEPQSNLDMVLQLPGTIDIAAAPAATVVVTAYRPIDSRLELAEALAGDLPRSVDSVDIDVAALASPAAGQLQLSIPLEVGVRTADALQLPIAGLYPVMVEVLDGTEVLAELATFVHRLPGSDDDPLEPLPVAFAVATTSPVVLDDDIDITLDAATLTELDQLADILEVSAMPISVRVPPALLAALAESDSIDDQVLLSRLVTELGDEEIVSAPSLPLDPSAAAAAGAGDLYTQWLRDGEDVLTRVVSTSPLRTIVLVDDPLSAGGGSLLRDLGGRLLVIPPEIYDVLPNTLGGFTESSYLVQIEVAPGVTVDATVIDRTNDDRLARPTSSAAHTAIVTVADLLMARQEAVDNGGDPTRRGITLGTPDLGLPPIDTVGALTTLIADTPGLRPVTLDELSVRTDRLVLDGIDVVVGLPPEVPGDITARITVRDQLVLEALSTGSMLPADDPRIAEWQRLISVIPTSALTDGQVAEIAADMRSQFDQVRASVVLPDGFSFTLTGRSTEVPITLQNVGDVPLTVVVRMRSPKMVFPAGDQTVTLLPAQFTEVRVPIEARTSGRFPVTLEVLTPLGESRLGSPVPLTARVTSLPGLGTLVTGAAVLVLLTWWVRHYRRSRRGRAAQTAASRHPATKDAVDDSGLSPDAATSTLPPS